MNPLLVIGFGNILRADDGAGIHVIRRMRQLPLSILKEAELIDGGTAGLNLLSLLQGRKKIIIVDAVLAEGPPGTIFRYSSEEIAQKGSALSLHQVSIVEVLGMLKLFDVEIEVDIFGIVPQDVNSMRMEPSAQVSAAIPKLIHMILESLHSVKLEA